MKYTIAATVQVLSTTGVMADGWYVVQQVDAGPVNGNGIVPSDPCCDGPGYIEGCPVPECKDKQECKHIVTATPGPFVDGQDICTNGQGCAHRPAPEELNGKVITCTHGQLWENGECQ